MANKSIVNALVPENEQPYKVPDNWVWVRLGDILSVSSGKGLTSKKMNQKGNIPVYGGNGITGYHNESNITANNIVIGRVGYYCGSIHMITESAWVTDNALIVSFDKEKIYLDFLYWLLMLTDLRVNDSSTAQPVISGGKIYNIPVPIIPIDEQKRIVERIENIFKKLDRAKDLTQNALESFETRKVAILHKAFTGELTAKWRKENGVKLENWETKDLQSVCSMKITDGTHQTPTYCDKEIGIPFISSKDVTTGNINWDKVKYITKELHKELYERLAPKRDDILLAKNGTTGVAAIVDTDIIFNIYVTLAILRPDKKYITPKYLLNIINSPICKEQFDENLTGIGVPNLHLRDIKEVRIPVPSLPEQQEIVRILDCLFEKERRAREFCSVIGKIDLMKKAILARAFRGELGTNVAGEEKVRVEI